MKPLDSKPLGKYMVAVTVADTWHIKSRSGDPLGTVEWYSGWKKYIFVPELGSEFNASCLFDLAHFMAQVNEERKIKNA